MKIKEYDINIPDKCKRIAFDLSGGPDSAILLYVMMEHIAKNNIQDIIVDIYTEAQICQNRINAVAAQECLDFIINKFFHKECKIPIGQHIILNAWHKEKAEYGETNWEVKKRAYKNNLIDIVINGMTCLPEKDVPIIVEGLDIRTHPGHPHWRHGYKHPLNWKYRGDKDMPLGYSPWVNKDKRYIGELYDKLGLRETLLPITRSCETLDLELINKRQTCKKCWACYERKFGINDW